MNEFKKSLATSTWPIKLIEKYEDIPGELPLLDNVYIDSNTHLGQRKLLLNEISFYNTIKSGTIIYSGSASGEHTPLILELFPNLNFIMIDPNYHIMNYDYMYIYKKHEGNLKEIQGLLKLCNPSRKAYLNNLIDKLKQKRCIDGKSYNTRLGNFGFKHFKELKELKFDSRVLVIQDYMSGELADMLKDKIKGPFYHISDIRSNNDDTSRLFDNALQLVIQHHLGCQSHLKFVVPKFINEVLKIDPWMMPVFEECKSLGFDFIKEYNSGTFNYTYLDGEIYIQPWARKMSGETRLLTNGGKRVYDCFEWRRKFNYYNFYRAHVANKSHKGYDGCNDCVLEVHIIEEYLKNNSTLPFSTIRQKMDEVTFHGLKNHKMNIIKIPNTIHYETITHRLSYKPNIESYQFKS